MPRIKHTKIKHEFHESMDEFSPSLLEVYFGNESMEKSQDHPKASPSAQAIATRPTFLGNSRRSRIGSRKRMSKSSIDNISLVDVFFGKEFFKSTESYNDHPAGSQSAVQYFAQPLYTIQHRRNQRIQNKKKKNNNSPQTQDRSGAQNTKEDSSTPIFTPRKTGISGISSVNNMQNDDSARRQFAPSNAANSPAVDFSKLKYPVVNSPRINQWGERMNEDDPEESFYFSFANMNLGQKG